MHRRNYTPKGPRPVHRPFRIGEPRFLPDSDEGDRRRYGFSVGHSSLFRQDETGTRVPIRTQTTKV
jgi:hypothetical protein